MTRWRPLSTLTQACRLALFPLQDTGAYHSKAMGRQDIHCLGTDGIWAGIRGRFDEIITETENFRDTYAGSSHFRYDMVLVSVSSPHR